jgi:hypothetical protein
MHLSRRVVAAFTVEAVLFGAVALVAADLYAHKRTDMLAGRNMWGYRGAVAHQRAPNEIRFELVGGTRAFALGMPASWTPATVVQQEVMLAIDRPGNKVIRHFIAVNLGQPGALPESYASTIEHFAYLKPDVICIYDDMGVGGAAQLEETSGTYAHTGYLPALPLVLSEKYSRVLQAAGGLLGRIDRSFARPHEAHALDPRTYAADMLRAVDVASRHAGAVLVVLSPIESTEQAAKRRALIAPLQERVASSPRVRLVELSGIPELTAGANRLDDWNYGGDAIAVAARTIAPAVFDLVKPLLN